MTGPATIEDTRRRAILDERTRRLAARRVTPDSERPVPVLVLGAGGERFALRLSDATEVGVMRPIAVLPRADPALVGLMDIRGTLCRLYDLGLLCGLASSGSRSGGHVVRLRTEAALALRVDRAEGMTDISPSGMRADPEFPPGRLGRRILAGYTLIDPASLLSHPALVEDA